MTEFQQPAAEFRVGGTITATVWRNEVQRDNETVVRYSVQIQKRYFDKADQEWKTANSFFPDDLPRIQLALAKAYEWIMMQSRSSSEAKDVAA